MIEIRPPVVVEYKVFKIDDIQKLASIFIEQSEEQKVETEFKVQFEDDHVSKVSSNSGIFTNNKVIDREISKIEMKLGSPEDNTYARLIINHGNDDASYLECSANSNTWAGGFEDMILKQIKQTDSQFIGKYQSIAGLLLFLVIWIGFTYALGNLLLTSGITSKLYNLAFSRAAVRIIPNSYAPHSYFLALFATEKIASYILNKLGDIFPIIDLRIGKNRNRSHNRLISTAKWFLGTLAIPALFIIIERSF